jgi:hypothetical protein
MSFKEEVCLVYLMKNVALVAIVGFTKMKQLYATGVTNTLVHTV